MIGLLHIGSHERQDDTVFSDIDLILLVEDLTIWDLRAIREIIRNLDYLVDMPVIQRNQLPTDPDLFQMGTHGCYFLYVLKSAQVIFGNNFFKDYPEATESAIRTSVFRKIAEYTWATRRTFVESNRERTMYQNYQLSSRLLKTVKDTLWLAGVYGAHTLTAAQSMTSLGITMPDILSDEEWKVMKMISDSEIRNTLAANMSEDFLQARMSVLEKLYAYAASLFSGHQ